MKLDHVGIWVNDLDKMISFYMYYFNSHPGEIYRNPSKNFTSCFVEFPSGGRVELMQNPGIPEDSGQSIQHSGYIHISVAVGSEREVDKMAEKFRNDHFTIVDGPRRTGDGYYEFVVLDPEGNSIEVTA